MPSKAKQTSEHDEQAALIRWATLASGTMPELRRLFAVPNGGARHPAVAAKLKAEGVKPGVSDLILLVPRHGYHGLLIEMKAAKGRLSKAQDEWLTAHAKDGYATYVCHDWESAKAVLVAYLGDGALALSTIH